MNTFDVNEAKEKFTQLIKRAMEGEDIIITMVGHHTVRLGKLHHVQARERVDTRKGKSVSRTISIHHYPEKEIYD